eukprot:3940399-Rhodomonas_salina.3
MSGTDLAFWAVEVEGLKLERTPLPGAIGIGLVDTDTDRWRYWNPTPLRTPYAQSSTDLAYHICTELLAPTRPTPSLVLTWRMCATRERDLLWFGYDPGLSPYAKATRCPVLRYRRVLSPYAIAMRWPVLRYRRVLCPYASAMR